MAEEASETENGGIPLTRDEAKRDFPEQFRTLQPLQGLDNKPGEPCGESDCVDHVIIRMTRDEAGQCTIYKRYRC